MDGGHIICLWITFFYKYYPELIQGGYLYTACPPLFRVIQKNKPDRFYFTQKELDEANTENCTVNRMKGLEEYRALIVFSVYQQGLCYFT